MYIVLVYDISLEEKGSTVLSRVFKICKKYLSHIQNSVFEGELSDAQLISLNYELQKVIRKDLDSVILFKSRHERWLEKDILGLKSNATSNFI